MSSNVHRLGPTALRAVAPGLNQLDLSGNMLAEVPSTLANLYQLTRLSLARNRIQTIRTDVFNNLTRWVEEFLQAVRIAPAYYKRIERT